jgi:His-Xaa-Ser system protein HxsD
MKTNALGNIKIMDDRAVMSINPKIYPLEVIYSAAYIMIDRAFIILDGDPTTQVSVEIRPKKNGQDINDLVIAFNEEILNYAVYKIQSERNQQLRQIILQRALFTNAPETFQKTDKPFTDPERIMEKWEPEDEP